MPTLEEKRAELTEALDTIGTLLRDHTGGDFTDGSYYVVAPEHFVLLDEMLRALKDLPYEIAAARRDRVVRLATENANWHHKD